MNVERTIPVPTWALDDNKLIDLRNTIIEVTAESGIDRRVEPCLTAIEAELEWRGLPVTLTPDGKFKR